MTHNPNHSPESSQNVTKADIEYIDGVAEMIPVHVTENMGRSALKEAKIYEVELVEYPNDAGGALVEVNGNHAAEFDGRDTGEEDSDEQQAA